MNAKVYFFNKLLLDEFLVEGNDSADADFQFVICDFGCAEFGAVEEEVVNVVFFLPGALIFAEDAEVGRECSVFVECNCCI